MKSENQNQMVKTSPSMNQNERPYHVLLLHAIFFCALCALACDPINGSPNDGKGDASGETPVSSGCEIDSDCVATFPHLPACRKAKCHEETGGCFVESVEDGLPCLSAEQPACAGECLAGSCTPVFCEEICTNGEDDDLDGATDCEDSECIGEDICQSHPCQDAFSLGCGDLILGSTLGPLATDGIHAVGCVGWDLSGPEQAYRIPASVATNYSLTLDPKSDDVRLVVLEGQPDGSCLPNACVAAGEDDVHWTAEDGQDYVVLVDGYQGAGGVFALHFECSATHETSCNNGEDEDGDGDLDCEDSDCADLPVCTECSPITSLGCGDMIEGSTLALNATSVFTDYGCDPEENLTGSEATYTIPAQPFPTEYSLALADEALTLHVVALGAEGDCQPAQCIGAGSSVTWISEPDVAYAAIIDSEKGEEGNYLIHLQCALSTEASCSNGVDDDGDGAKDCEDTDCMDKPECASCAPLFGLDCGSEVTLGTGHPLATSIISSSGCSALPTPGPELVFSFDGKATQNVQFTLESESTQAILTVFDLSNGADCEPDSCAGQDNGAVTVETTEGSQHAVVIDSLNEETVPFTLSVSCGTQEEWICSNGEDEDLDQLVDCLDPDCENHPDCSTCVIVEDLDCGTEVISPSSSLFYTIKIDQYGCGFSVLDGPEVTYRVAPKLGQTMSISVETLSEGALLSMIGSPSSGPCDPSDCLDSNPTSVSFESTLANPDALLVVDMPFADTQPFVLTVTCSEVPELDCENNIDDDNDGVVDCDDPDCFSDAKCAGIETDCDNNLDDDDNGDVDCNDNACALAPNCGTCSSAAKIECGESLMGLTSGDLSATNISNYPCGEPITLPGSEQAIRIAEALTGPTKLVVYGDPQVQMAVIAESGPGCYASNCIDMVSISAGNYDFDPLPDHTYYLVFDSETATPGAYSVELVCNVNQP